MTLPFFFAIFSVTDLKRRPSWFWEPERILQVKRQADDVIDADVGRISGINYIKSFRKYNTEVVERFHNNVLPKSICRFIVTGKFF
jgi:hypothetical protein